MYTRLKLKYALWVQYRVTVLDLVHVLDPNGINETSKYRLKRRSYKVWGPNFIWHIDGYDRVILSSTRLLFSRLPFCSFYYVSLRNCSNEARLRLRLSAWPLVLLAWFICNYKIGFVTNFYCHTHTHTHTHTYTHTHTHTHIHRDIEKIR